LSENAPRYEASVEVLREAIARVGHHDIDAAG